MLIVYAASLALLFLALVPTATGFLAKRLGRPFWTWFVISMFLPLIATFILMFLPELPQKKLTS